eukprot:gene23130-28113_t
MQQEAAKQQAMANAANAPATARKFQFFAAFDGTNNDKDNVPKGEFQTNVANLFVQARTASESNAASNLAVGNCKGGGTCGNDEIGGSTRNDKLRAANDSGSLLLTAALVAWNWQGICIFVNMVPIGEEPPHLGDFDRSKAQSLSAERRAELERELFSELWMWNGSSRRYGPPNGRAERQQRWIEMAQEGSELAYLTLKVLPPDSFARDPRPTLKRLEEIAQQGNAAAMCLYGGIVFQLPYGVVDWTPQEERGRLWVLKGAELGHPACLIRLGGWRMSGYIPPKDLKLGLEMTYQALRSGYDHGARSLWVRARELNFVDPPSRKLEYCWAYSLAKYEDSEADSFFEGMNMSNINTSILPVVKTEWQAQLYALQQANKNANTTVTSIQRRIDDNAALATTLKPQLEKAQLAQLAAVQKYNSFIESGSQMLKVAADAGTRLQSSKLSLLERSQLEHARDNMINLASEFITFKSQNGAKLEFLSPMDIGAKTYYSNGRIEWNNSILGQLGQLWDGTKEIAPPLKDALLKGPLTTEQNYTICANSLGEVLTGLAGKILKPIPGTPDNLWDKILDQAVGATDPAGVTCRLVYPKGMSPRELWLLGEVIQGGESEALLIKPEKFASAILMEAFSDAQIQGLWSSAQANQVIKAVTGNDWTPFLDAPDSLADFSALAPVWANPQWGIQLASAGGIESDAGNGLYLGDLGTSIYSLADGGLKARVGEDGAGLLLGNDSTDELKFGAGTSWELTGTGLKVTANNQTTTRNWLTDNVYQTDTFVGPPAPTNTTPNTAPTFSSLDFGPVSYNLFDAAQNNNASYKMWQLNQNNGLSSNAYNSFTQQSSNFVVDYSLGGTGSSGLGLQPPPSWSDPIGAFYDSQSSAFDNAASIANKTTRAMNAQGQGLSAAQLAALDTNNDGQLSTAEASGVRLWADVNEDGHLDSGELLSVNSPLKSADYNFYTRGSALTVSASADAPLVPTINVPTDRPQTLTANSPGNTVLTGPVAPVNPVYASLPVAIGFTAAALPAAPGYGGVPASNYRSLRDTDNVYLFGNGSFVAFTASQVKINNGNRTYMIGTDGADSFDSSTYANTGFFNNNLLVVNLVIDNNWAVNDPNFLIAANRL